MSDILSLALACAVQLTGLPAADPAALTWHQREPNAAEKREYRTPLAVGLFVPQTGTLYADPQNWPVLVHEATHFLQWRAGHFDVALIAYAAGNLEVMRTEQHASEAVAKDAQTRAEECR